MDKFVILSAHERAQIFRETAIRRAMTPAVVEKDFWVCWVLDRLFTSKFLKDKILFKGGTSISKVFGLIERFSEDIDLILDWREVTPENPEAHRSKNRQEKFNKQMNDLSRRYLQEVFLPELIAEFGRIVAANINPKTLDVIDIIYPCSFKETYLRPEVRLEIGPLASWLPNDEYAITPYAAESFPHLFRRAKVSVKAIKAERTFWEKVTILHQEAHRPRNKIQPFRLSRHYYDLMRMALSSVKKHALDDIDLLQRVANFKTKFYPCSWARYDLALPGTLKLIPPIYHISSLKKDYEQMRVMIYGDAPAFDNILSILEKLENEINGMKNR